MLELPGRSLPSAQRLQALLGWAPASLEPLGGGRNSQLCKVSGTECQAAALKVYFQHPGDRRDRLGTEFGALTFCWELGLRSVPRPLAADPEGHFALYEFIQGEPVPAPAAADVEQAVAFLVRLHGLASHPRAFELPAASEACFSFEALEANLVERLAALEAAAGGGPLRTFLDRELLPALKGLLAQCRDRCRRHGVPLGQPLALRDRTLSPSDFGFHNALRRDGRMVFFDFEYFGWDDPAKTLSDLLLHPGMCLSQERRRQFALGLLDGLAAVPGLARRARLAFPLYGIKWCLILLNEFLPGPMERRAFAAQDGRSMEDNQARQLQKAQDKLTQILDEHENFPYFQP